MAAFIVLLMILCFTSYGLAWLCIWRRWFTRWVRGLLLCSQMSSLLLLPAAIYFAYMVLSETFWEHGLHISHNIWMVVFYGFVFPPLLIFIARSSFTRRYSIHHPGSTTL